MKCGFSDDATIIYGRPLWNFSGPAMFCVFALGGLISVMGAIMDAMIFDVVARDAGQKP